MDLKSEKRQFSSEEIRSTGTVTTEPVNVSKDRNYLDVRFKLACKYVPHGYDPANEDDDPLYYTHVREVSVRGKVTYSLPMNLLRGLRRGMFVTVIGKISGEHIDGEHQILILADEVSSNWRFGTWTRGEAPESEDEEEAIPRRRRRRSAEPESDGDESSSTNRRRRRSNVTFEPVKPETLSTGRTRGSSTPKIEMRGDDDASENVFEEE